MDIVTRKVNKINRSVSVVIPKEIQQAMRIKSGDEVSFRVNDDGDVVLRKVTHAREDDAQLLTEIQQLYDEFADSMGYLKDK